MKMVSHADFDPVLANAIGRFAQASAQLEHAVQAAITRILPLTTDMGLALLYESSIGRDLQILNVLLHLPETSITDDWRQRLLERIPLVQDSIELRNRLLHNPIVDGQESLAVMMHRKGKRSALEINAATIISWAEEAAEHAFWFHTVPHGIYDFAQWEKRFAEYETKDWPARRKASAKKAKQPLKSEG
ncbi:hypothetical protein OE766_05470 [Pararhizobium sp. YC-54]|uniref:hypothetical protein n=1 Tax=Pararhizobium sp. YC-54 TaxID=2986920 RepID=UPI0021F6D941|nr:hypothetical protein [Pararhizobium sp. YC-54]MCV9997689.1 hypothetical protein [Pararhizobium sp. YC-54]